MPCVQVEALPPETQETCRHGAMPPCDRHITAIFPLVSCRVRPRHVAPCSAARSRAPYGATERVCTWRSAGPTRPAAPCAAILLCAACGAILRRAARRVHMQAACENEGRQHTRLSEIPLRCQNPSERKIGLFQDCLIWRVSTPPYGGRHRGQPAEYGAMSAPFSLCSGAIMAPGGSSNPGRHDF